jgi:hypothetical protein
MNPALSIEAVVRDVIERRARGEWMSDAEVFAAYPGHVAELALELRKLQDLRAAGLHAQGLPTTTTDQARPADGRTPVERKPAGAPPTVPDYDLSRRIGAGGFGEVWLGRNRHTGQWCAVKLFPAANAIELDGVRAYKSRVQGHPNLVAIEHVGTLADGAYLYYTMPLADGANGAAPVADLQDYEPLSLQRFLECRRAPLPVAEVLAIARQLLAALEHLHEAGLIHRDVKPANVMRVRGAWQLGDIGLAVRGDQTQADCGTRQFWPPEGPRDRTADLYALGKALFLLASGRDLARFGEFIAGKLDLPGDDRRSKKLGAIIRKACSDDPLRRYPTAQQMRRDTAQLIDGESVVRRRLVVGLAGATAAVVLAAIAGYHFWTKPPRGELRIAAMEIQVQRGDGGTGDEFLGEMGTHCFETACKDDLARIIADLSEPAYSFLIAFSPDGSDQLCAPPDAFKPPSPSQTVEGRWRFNEGVGLQAFVLVAAREPLPAYVEWRRCLLEVPWGKVAANGVWRSDGIWIERRDENPRMPTQVRVARRRLTESGMPGLRAPQKLAPAPPDSRDERSLRRPPRPQDRSLSPDNTDRAAGASVNKAGSVFLLPVSLNRPNPGCAKSEMLEQRGRLRHPKRTAGIGGNALLDRPSSPDRLVQAPPVQPPEQPPPPSFSELPGEPEVFRRLCEHLKNQPGIRAIRAIAFSVKPSPRITGASSVALAVAPGEVSALSAFSALLTGEVVTVSRRIAPLRVRAPAPEP